MTRIIVAQRFDMMLLKTVADCAYSHRILVAKVSWNTKKRQQNQRVPGARASPPPTFKKCVIRAIEEQCLTMQEACQYCFITYFM